MNATGAVIGPCPLVMYYRVQKHEVRLRKLSFLCFVQHGARLKSVCAIISDWTSEDLGKVKQRLFTNKEGSNGGEKYSWRLKNA